MTEPSGKTGVTWLPIRLGLMALAFLGGMFMPAPATTGDTGALYAGVVVSVLFLLVFVPLVVLLVIGIQAMLGVGHDKWHRPKHCTNPFQIGNPLPFTHFLGCLVGALGLGGLVAGLWRGAMIALLGGHVVLIGVLMLIGVHLAMRLFYHKMTDAPGRADAEDDATR